MHAHYVSIVKILLHSFSVTSSCQGVSCLRMGLCEWVCALGCTSWGCVIQPVKMYKKSLYFVLVQQLFGSCILNNHSLF